jgi:hypothetical protein
MEQAAEEDVRRTQHAERIAEGSPWKKVTGPSQRREMAATAVVGRGVSVAVACRTFGVSETCYRYSPLLSDENEQIADLLVGLTDARKTWGFELCFLHLRNIKGLSWSHKRVYRIYCALELNLRIKHRKRLKRDKTIKDNNARQIHRAMRGVAFAVAVTRYHDGSSIAALQGFNPEVRITCLAAIYAVQQKLLLKAARIRAKVDDFAKASLLKAYSKEPHLLAAVRGIADRRSQGVSSADRARFTAQGAPDSHNSSQRNGQNTGQREDSRS